MAKTDDERINLAGEAERIWNSPMVKGFMDNFIKQLFVEWTNAKSEKERDDLWHEAQVAAKFKDRFLRYISDGKATVRRREDGGVIDNIGPII